MGTSLNNEKECILDVLKNLDLNSANNWEKALVLDAVGEAIRLDKDEAYVEFLNTEIDKLVKEGAVALGDGELVNMLVADVCYKADKGDIAIETAKQTKTQTRCQEGYFTEANGNKDLATAFGALKFYMNYETKNGGKENYNDIIAQYKAIHKDLFEKTKDSMMSGDVKAFRSLVLYSAGLIDTMEVMDQALYEIFGKLRDFFKETVKAVSSFIGTIEGEEEYKLIYTYAVFKGCRMKALHTEKHEAVVAGIYNKAASESCELKNKNVLYVGAFILAYSEFIKNREYQDYGRSRGGVLWN